MRAALFIAASALCIVELTAAASQTPSPGSPGSPAPPATDIYLVEFAGGITSMNTAKVSPVSTAPGYDNQPAFSADGSRILFAANRDGRQIDVYVYDRTTKRVSQLTKTAENENSPSFLPPGVGDSGAFSVVRTESDRTQRLWRFDAQGRNPQVVLTDVKPVGYYAWVDVAHVGVFVLGSPATLQLADVTIGKTETVAEGIGRSLHRVPGTRAVSFVQREASGEYWIKQIDIASKKIDMLVKAVDGSADRDMAWMPDGQSVLMSAGTKVFAWSRGGTEWTEVFDAAARDLGTVSRLSVSPRGDAIAFVVAEPKR